MPIDFTTFSDSAEVVVDEKKEEEWQSRAVIACDAKGNGCVVWYIGRSLAIEISEAGSTDLGNLGLDDAPHGISIWEGEYVRGPGSYENPDDGMTLPSSSSAFRVPTDEEWTAIREQRNPWPEWEPEREQ